MSLKKVKEAKSDGWFRPLDLIIYAAIAVVAAAIFCAFFFAGGGGGFDGVRVSVDGQTVYEYTFSAGGSNLSPQTVEEEESGALVLIKVQTPWGYNVVCVDREKRSVKITEADCKGGDCKLPEISRGGTVIYCSPHRLTVTPITSSASPEVPIG